jgi:hypothetical protein
VFEDNQFESFFNEVEDFCNDLIKITAQSATVRASLTRVRVRRAPVRVRVYRRARLRVPDRQWHAPIRANAPPKD